MATLGTKLLISPIRSPPLSPFLKSKGVKPRRSSLFLYLTFFIDTFQ